jgi:hypothetical protein
MFRFSACVRGLARYPLRLANGRRFDLAEGQVSEAVVATAERNARVKFAGSVNASRETARLL